MNVKPFPSFASRLSIYTFGHFFFEFAANYFIISLIAPQISTSAQMIEVLLCYNLCDYGTQVLIGVVDDIVHRNHYFASVGALLFVIGYFCSPIPLLMATVIGLGAAFIHVPLGRQVLLDRPHIYTPLAPFVASGAFGVFLGRQAGFSPLPLAVPVIVCAILLMLGLVALGSGEREGNASVERQNATQKLRFTAPFICAVLILLLAVVAQSFTFAILVFRWDRGAMAWAAAIAILLGKGIGGLLADRFGYRSTIIGSSLVALAAASFAPAHPILGLVFLFALNIPSATLIFRIAKRFAPALGTGFGLYKFFHLVGFFPTLFWGTGQLVSPVTLLVLTVVIAALMLAEGQIKE